MFLCTVMDSDIGQVVFQPPPETMAPENFVSMTSGGAEGVV